MAEDETPYSTSEVRPVSIEIEQGQKTGAHRTLTKTIKIAEGVKTGVVWIRTLGIQIAERIKTFVVRTAMSTAAESGERIEIRRWRERRKPRDAIEAVARDLWPPDGKPPSSMPTPHAVQMLGNEYRRRTKINAKPDSLKRAIGRR